MHSGANKTSQRVKNRCAIVAVRPRKRFIIIAMMVGWLPWGCAACGVPADAFQPALFPSLDQKLSCFALLPLRPAWLAFPVSYYAINVSRGLCVCLLSLAALCLPLSPTCCWLAT